MEKQSEEKGVKNTPAIPDQQGEERAVNAAFDSVKLIAQLNSLPTLTDQEKERKERNVKHLEIMMQKDWFVDQLTDGQKAEIKNVIP